jgi:hypothetical protein
MLCGETGHAVLLAGQNEEEREVTVERLEIQDAAGRSGPSGPATDPEHRK